MGRSFPSLKTAPFHEGIWALSNTWFLGTTRVNNAKGISIGSAVFTGLTIATDRETDHATPSVTIGRIYISSTAMRPNNSNYKCGPMPNVMPKKI